MLGFSADTDNGEAVPDDFLRPIDIAQVDQ
jgi:hypothetical protein